LKFTVEFDSNPLPVIVTVAECACGRLVGERLLTFGVGLITEKFTAVEVPPPGDGLFTVMAATAPAASAEAGTCACSVVELVYVVGIGLPANHTTEPCTKLDPVTVIVWAAAPAVMLAGETESTCGVGLFPCC
jgi:hypothetical protein